MSRGGLKSIVFEAAAVTLVGTALALAANAVSPGGLSLTKNYFPGATPDSVSSPIPVGSSAPNSTNLASGNQLLVGRIKAEGLQVIDRDQAAKLFENSGSGPMSVVFVDARDTEHYREGHVPGAYELDPYHPEKNLGDLLPVCQMTEQIIVYCYGGDCEDSRFAATTLRNAGIPGQKLFVYTGGISEWTNSSLPLEIGERNSGNVHPGAP